MTEADTCRKFVVPLLQKAGWDNDPHSIAEQRYFTAGRIVSQGQTARRRPGKRADQFKKHQAAFFAYYTPEAREILGELSEKYAADGEVQFTLPDVLKVPPISRHGTVGEIASPFGGPEQLRSEVNRLQTMLYAP